MSCEQWINLQQHINLVFLVKFCRNKIEKNKPRTTSHKQQVDDRAHPSWATPLGLASNVRPLNYMLRS